MRRKDHADEDRSIAELREYVTLSEEYLLAGQVPAHEYDRFIETLEWCQRTLLVAELRRRWPTLYLLHPNVIMYRLIYS